MTSAGVAAAKSPGEGHCFIHEIHAGATRATGVCCDITSLTKMPHAEALGVRHGNSRADAVNQFVTGSQIAVPLTVSRTPDPIAGVTGQVCRHWDGGKWRRVP
jgi:hypothetical protein